MFQARQSTGRQICAPTVLIWKSWHGGWRFVKMQKEGCFLTQDSRLDSRLKTWGILLLRYGSHIFGALAIIVRIREVMQNPKSGKYCEFRGNSHPPLLWEKSARLLLVFLHFFPFNKFLKWYKVVSWRMLLALRRSLISSLLPDLQDQSRLQRWVKPWKAHQLNLVKPYDQTCPQIGFIRWERQ